ncbi:MAG: SpoIIE family protein phosphatase [Planctomycetes bacterium]|nr:SpoIIE family protein phosphatase [Planctomycetota bacterium]
MWYSEGLLLPGYEIAALNRAGACPAHEIGVVRISSDKLAVWVIRESDREGRDRVINQLESALKTRSPERVLVQLNDSICEEAIADSQKLSLWPCVCIMVFDHSQHVLSVSTAGIEGPELLRSDDTLILPEQDRCGIPLGMFPGTVYETQSVHVESLMSVIWVSPYSADCTDPKGQVYAHCGLSPQILAGPRRPKSFVEYLASDIDRHMAGKVQIEDICVFCTRRQD